MGDAIVMPRTPRDFDEWKAARRRRLRGRTAREIAPTLALIVAAIAVLVLVAITVTQS